MNTQPLVPVALAVMVGIVLHLWIPVPWTMSLTLSGISVLVALRLQRHARGMQWAVLCAVLCLSMTRVALQTAYPAHHLIHHVTAARIFVHAHGRIMSDPQQTEHPQPRTTAVMALDALQIDGRWQPITGRAYVKISQPRVQVRYGDTLLLTGWLTAPSRPANPGGFDQHAFFLHRNIHAVLTVRPYDALVIQARGGGAPVAWIYRLRAAAQAVIRQYTPPNVAGLLSAILLGLRQDLLPAWRTTLIETGTVHVIAISGLHVGMLAMAMLWLLRLCWVPRAWRLVLTMGMLGCMVIMTGGQAPVVRAAIMGWLLLGGALLHRTRTIANALAAAALALLWWQPLQLCDAGFQLSFVSVMALVVGVPKVYAWMISTRVGQHLAAYDVGVYGMQLCAASFCAWCGVAPLLLVHMGQVSLVAVCVNICVIPLLSGVLFGGYVLIVVGALSSIGGLYIGACLADLVTGLMACLTWCAQLPFTVYAARWSPWLAAGCYVGVMLTALRRRGHWSTYHMTCVWCVLLNIWVWGHVGALWLQPSTLRMTAIDVGHGDALLIEFPGGGRMLIDGGARYPYDQGRRTIIPYLRARRIRRLDAVVLTHPDGDHVGGLASVLEALDVGVVIDNGARADTAGFRAYEAAITQQEIPRLQVQRGDQLRGFPAVQIDVLHPDRTDVLSSNDRSLILRARHGRRTWMFSGDADEAALARVMAREPTLQVDVLKVPHHGSSLGALTDDFYAQMAPTIAVISMQAHAWLPLPHGDTLAALDRVGSTWLMTGRDGAVTVSSDGDKLHVTPYRPEGLFE